MTDEHVSPLLLVVASLANRIDSDAKSMRDLELRKVRTEAKLDEAMVAAVDVGGEKAMVVARLAGYKGPSAIRDARRRIEKRRVEVR